MSLNFLVVTYVAPYWTVKDEKLNSNALRGKICIHIQTEYKHKWACYV